MSEAASIRSAGERERKHHSDQSYGQSPLSSEAAQELIRQNDWQRDAMKRSAHARELQGKAQLRAGNSGGATSYGEGDGEQQRDARESGNSRRAEQHARSPWQQLLDARQEIRDDRHYANQEKAGRKDAQYLVRDSKKTAYEGRQLLRRSQREFDHGCTAQGMSDQRDAIMLLNESLKETAQGRDNWSKAQVDLYDARRRYWADQHELKEARRQTSSSDLCQSGQWQRDNNTRYQNSSEQTTEYSPQPIRQQPLGIDQQQEQRLEEQQQRQQQQELLQEQQRQQQQGLESSQPRYTRQPAQENYNGGSYRDCQPSWFERALQTVNHLANRVHISVGLGNGILNFGNNGYGFQRPYYPNYYNNNQYQNQYYQQQYYPNYNNQSQYYNVDYNSTLYNNNQVNPGYYPPRHRHHWQDQTNPTPLYNYNGQSLF
jgi:hypothetical protein